MCVQIDTINIPICILQGMIVVAAVVLILKFQNTCELGETHHLAHVQVRRFEVRSTHRGTFRRKIAVLKGLFSFRR